MDKKPISKDLFPIVESRYEDFVALHANATAGGVSLLNTKGLRSFANNDTQRERMMDYGIHNAGIFLPWHRYTLQVWEDALRDECGWNDAHPCRFEFTTCHVRRLTNNRLGLEQGYYRKWRELVELTSV